MLVLFLFFWFPTWIYSTASVVALVVSALIILGLVALLFWVIWMIDKSLARAAYKREELDLPPSWHDGFSKWEFEKITD